MIIMGAGICQWFHGDATYRAILSLLILTGSMGRNGGGWAHYVGQEKCRPITGWISLANGLDWSRPPRTMTGTSFWYMHTGQWRTDGYSADSLGSPLAKGHLSGMHTADTIAQSAARGWMPFYPQFDQNPMDVADAATAAVEAGEAATPAAYVADALDRGDLKPAIADVDAPESWPRTLVLWRSNLFGSSAKGNEYFLKNLLGTHSNVLGTDGEGGENPETPRPSRVAWHEDPPEGKLDLLVSADFRMTSTTLLSDVVLPAATWYEKHDLSSTDMHPFVHAFSPAIDPPWEARTDFEAFHALARRLSELAEDHLGTRKDLVSVPLQHDTPGETPLDPDHTRPVYQVVERDYTAIADKLASVGPLADSLGFTVKNVTYRRRASRWRRWATATASCPTEPAPVGRPSTPTRRWPRPSCASPARRTARSPCRDSRRSRSGSGKKLHDLAEGSEEKRISFADTQAAPVPVITSPEWSGSETGGRRYAPFTVNIERLKPFHTLTGRMHFYLDHDWMTDLGEALPTYRPPLDMQRLFGEPALGPDGALQITVRYLTPHSKWSIHSEYQDNLFMLSLSRGGPDRLDEPPGRRRDRRARQRLGRVHQRQRRPRRPGDRQPPDAAGRRLRPPRAGAHHRRPEVGGHRTAWRHPQLGDPAAGQAHAPDRRLRTAVLHVQLPRPHRQPARHGLHDPQALAGGDVLMRVMAQMGMVMNLDKCIGCQTCSVTCKQAWTNRAGTEYIWFNNVETRPGQGYPRRHEDQEKWKGGWELNKRGRLQLRTGGRLKRLLSIFASPVQPELGDYYEPWTYDYKTLVEAPLGDDFPVARPKSLITGEDTKVTWSANWDDNLGGRLRDGAPRPDRPADPARVRGQDQVRVRADVHVLPAPDLRALPQPGLHGVLPVGRDLQALRGRHRAGRPGPLPRLAPVHHRLPVQEDLLQPQVRQGREVHVLLPPHRGRHPDRVLGDVRGPAALPRAVPVRRRRRSRRRRRCPTTGTSTRPRWTSSSTRRTPSVIAAAREQGIPEDWLDAARRSPVYALAKKYRVALPLHPEYRTMPMVWYVPPLSPVVDLLTEQGHDAEDSDVLFGAIEALRIPVEYLAELFTAGDTEVIDGVLRKLAAMRAYMRGLNLGREPDASIPAAVGMSEESLYEMYRLMAIAKYDERYVIPKAHVEQAHDLEELGLLPGLRRGSRHVRLRSVRRGQRSTGAGGGRELPRPQAAPDHRRTGR